MAEIISIDEKRQFSDKEKAARIRNRKLLAVRKMLQCSHCRMKCEKCGTHMEPGMGEPDDGRLPFHIPYRFCSSCSEEYLDFIDRLKGNGDPNYYWHNEAWMKSWQAWIDYKGALDQHSKSKEFTKLLKELEEGKTIE